MIKFRIGLIAIVLTGLLFSSCNKHIAQSKETKQTYYTCPMHSDVIEMRPGKCPKCGMTLVIMDWDNFLPKKSGSSGSGSFGSGSIGGHSGHNH